MDFQRLHAHRSWFRCVVSCGLSKGWGLFIGWEEVFSLCFLHSLLHASEVAAEGFGAAGDDGGEEEHEIPHVDLVVISYVCKGLFVSLGCNILLC